MPTRRFPRPNRPAPRSGDRLRLGLTGLGAIFLLVMVVAASLKPALQVREDGRQGESLAVLGVAPGAGQGEQAQVAHSQSAKAERAQVARAQAERSAGAQDRAAPSR